MNEPKGDDITPNKDGGILKELLKAGDASDETPFVGDNVIVHYTGTLLDGTKFDSSRDRNEKFKFDIGKGTVIKGWDIGIATMKRNEQARFYIRSDYGYGDRGSGGTIPPKATLVFDVELFDFFGEDISKESDQSVLRRTIKAGEGYSTPNEGARVSVHLKGLYNNRVFDERDTEFEIGEGSKSNIVEGVEQGLEKFKKGEVSRLNIKSKYAWGKTGNAEFGIPANADVVYEVNLKTFEKAKESWQLDGKEKLEQCELFKTKGTELFKENKYNLAVKKYNKICDFLENETYTQEDEIAKSKQLLLAANLNIAVCNLKLNENLKAIEACEKVLKQDEQNEKALFRIAQANFNLGNFDAAIKYFSRVLDINEQNKEARVQLTLTKQKLKEYNEKEKKLYSKMFGALTKSSTTTSTGTTTANNTNAVTDEVKNNDNLISDADVSRQP